MLRNVTGIPNWEMVAFVIINKLLVGNNRRFSRSEIMTIENLSLAEFVTGGLGHKRNPKCAEQTLQRTLQNMRDKGYINFLERGEYRITELGYNKAKAYREEISYEKWMSVYRKNMAETRQNKVI